jgi:hypothetical protein
MRNAGMPVMASRWEPKRARKAGLMTLSGFGRRKTEGSTTGRLRAIAFVSDCLARASTAKTVGLKTGEVRLLQIREQQQSKEIN